MDANGKSYYCGARVPVSWHEKIQVAAQAQDRTASALLRRLVRQELERCGLLPGGEQVQPVQPAGGVNHVSNS